MVASFLMESRSKRTRRRQRPRDVVSKGYSYGCTHFLVLLLLGLLVVLDTAQAQFNEPPGQRREQTFRVVEFEMSNINQHYPGDLRYYCTFRGKWTPERHPTHFPQSASWSAPVIVSHSKDWRMWTGTETVTAGIEYMAEEGFPTILYNEFANAGYESLQMIIGERMYNTSESQHLPPINVTYSHPWLSAVTKISPSPDWFVGFSDFRTISYDTETFYNRVVIQSYVWDAGTDDGQDYLSFDRDLDPQMPCMRFCVPPHVGEGGVGTYDSNIKHIPGANQIHHPTGNTKTCPDKSKGRVAVPRTGQFLDYSASYIPFPAEYECVLRVGDGQVFAGNSFSEAQIRPPKFVARPDDDFLDGLSPYDQPAYDNYVASLNGDPVEEENPWDKRWLLLPVLLFFCCCPCGVALIWLYLSYRRRKQNEHMDDEQSELYLDMFIDEGVVPEDGEYHDDRSGTISRSIDNIEEHDDDHVRNSRLSVMDNSVSSNYYGENDIDTSHNTGVSAGDDYDSWLASQNVSQQVAYEDEDGSDSSSDDGGDGNNRSTGSNDDGDGDESISSDDGDYGRKERPDSQSLKPPSMASLGGSDNL